MKLGRVFLLTCFLLVVVFIFLFFNQFGITGGVIGISESDKTFVDVIVEGFNNFFSGEDSPSLSEESGGPLEAVPLQDNQAYIRNPTIQQITNELVTIPIGFQRGQYDSATISNVRLQGLKTQAYPTSYYSDNSVRTAVIYTLATLPANTENVYQIVDDSTPQTFVYHPAVQDFLLQGEITVITRDLNGNAYPVTVPLASLTPEVDGPVVKKYRYIKAHTKPVSGLHPIEYLFTSVFEIELVSNQPWIKIQHLVVNSHNLAEDLQTGLNYRDGQLGDVKYQNIEMYFDNVNPAYSSNVYVSLFDANALAPTRLDTKPSPQANRLWIMPTDGQQILANTPAYNRWNNQWNVPYNYLAAGQGFLTEVTLFLDTANNPSKVYDPIYESPLYAGTALSRFALIDDGPFQDVPNPQYIGVGSRFTFDALANQEFGTAFADRGREGYRFGLLGIDKFDPGSAGFNGVNDKIDRPFIYYLMSCYDRCNPNLLQTMRNYKYGAPYTGDLVVGFNPRNHPLAHLYVYRTRLFPNCVRDEQGQPKEDWLGYCNMQTQTRAPSFVSAEGSRNWLAFDDAHASVGRGIGYYLLTGDRMSYYITEYAYAPNVAHANYGARLGSAFQARAFGRLGHSLTDLYLTETDVVDRQYLVTTAEGVVQMVDSRRDKSAPGTRGSHPVTGDSYAVGFVDNFVGGGGYQCKDMNGQPLPSCEERAFTWQDSKIIEGLTELYRSIPVQNLALLKTTIEEMVKTQFTYGYRDFDNVRNSFPGLALGTFISEGTGYFANTLVIGPPTAGYCTPPNCGPNQIPLANAINTYYGDAYVDYNFPALCLALKYVVDPNNPQRADWEQKFRRAILAGMVYDVSTNDAGQFAYRRGISVSNTYFGGWVCPMHFALGLPNGRESPRPIDIDDDGDGFSEAIGDCNDNNLNIHPAQGEANGGSCTDGVDNNCNGLTDCDDPQCTVNTWPYSNCDCRKNIIVCSGNPPVCNNICPGTDLAFSGDGIVQNPNVEGRPEQCDLNIIVGTWGYSGAGTSTNACTDGRCIHTMIYAEGKNSMCYSSSTQPPTLASLNPNSIPFSSSSTVRLTGTNFDTNPLARVKIDNIVISQSLVNVLGSTSIDLTVLGSSLSGGPHTVTVINFNNQESTPRTLTVQATTAPVLDSITPPIITVEVPTTLNFHGSNFESNSIIQTCDSLSNCENGASGHISNILLEWAGYFPLSTGTHRFRIRNPDNQVSAIKSITVQAPAVCSGSQTRPCSLQTGVCAGSFETCTGSQWPGCTAANYGPNYAQFENTDALCRDGYDNDCDSPSLSFVTRDYYVQPPNGRADDNCAVGIDAITAPSSVCSGRNFTMFCTSTVGNIGGIFGGFLGASSCVFQGWSGNSIQILCINATRTENATCFLSPESTPIPGKEFKMQRVIVDSSSSCLLNPVLTKIEPLAIVNNKSNTLVFTGSGFSNVCGIEIGGLLASSPFITNCINSTQINFTVPLFNPPAPAGSYSMNVWGNYSGTVRRSATINITVNSPAYCGDLMCNNGETCSSCPGDCTVGCGGSSGGGSGGGSSGGGGSGGSIVKPQCSDGKDNDRDGKIDYPADLGCTSKNGNSELDFLKNDSLTSFAGSLTNDSEEEYEGSSEKGTEIRVVFWGLIILLTGVIIFITVLIIRSLKMHTRLVKLSRVAKITH